MLPLILFGAAYLIGRTTKETTEFADGGMMAKGGMNDYSIGKYFVDNEKTNFGYAVKINRKDKGLATISYHKTKSEANKERDKLNADGGMMADGGTTGAGSFADGGVMNGGTTGAGSYADGGMMAKGGEIEEGDVVIVKSENLKAEVTNVGTDFITVEFIGKRPEGGDKRGTYKKSDLKKNKK
jgi:hypothetical protein